MNGMLMFGSEGGDRAVLRLLTMIGVEGAHTITLYTSRKGRTWATVKTWGDPTYTTSSEVDNMEGEHGLIKGLVSALVIHSMKVRELAPRADTWLSIDRVNDNWRDIEDATVQLLQATAPSPNGVEGDQGKRTKTARPSPQATK